METVRAYESILDAAFVKHFPGWAEMSPFDPVKVLVEGLVSSLSAVEERQRRVIDSALDCLPALFAVAPKAGRLPVGLFQLRPALRVRETVTLDEKIPFRFQSATETLSLTPVRPVRLAPVAELRESREGNAVELRISYRGPVVAVTLGFLPAAEAEETQLVDATLNGLRFGELAVEDGTDGLLHFGELVVARRDRAPVSGDAELRLVFSRPPAGRFVVNVFPFHYGRLVDALPLGALLGEAWEEIPLPEAMPAAPTEVLVTMPDGRERRLEPIGDEALRDVSRLTGGFLYHGVRHAIVLPGADTLVGSYNGGVELRAPAMVLVPGPEWLGDGYQAVLAEHVTTIEAMTAVAPLLPAVPRETPAAYLARFYSQWRAFRAQSARVRPALLAAELEQDLLGADERVRAVEVSVDAETSMVTVHCLVEHPEAEAFRIEADIAAVLRARLAATVPLPYRSRLRPFRAVPVDVGVTLRIDAAEARLGALTPATLEAAVAAACTRLLRPPPFGDLAARRSLGKETLAELLRAELTGSVVLAAELSAIELTLRDATGAFLGGLSRDAGDCLRPSVRTKVDLRIVREAAHA